MTGAEPDVDGVLNMETYAIEYIDCATAGKFLPARKFRFPNRPCGWDVLRVTLKLPGTQDTWEVSISDGTYSTVWLSGTDETDVVWSSPLFLKPNEFLAVTTTGAGLVGYENVRCEVVFKWSDVYPTLDTI